MQFTRKPASALALMVLALGMTTSNAQAASYRFGTDERLYAYANTGMSHENKPLALCYKTSTYNLFAPVYTTDERVLCDVSTKTYWPVPSGERLKKLQTEGLLPTPLPNYERPAFDYLMGFLLWIVVAGLGAFGLAAAVMKRSTDDDHEATNHTPQ